jgi:hypothetical protein
MSDQQDDVAVAVAAAAAAAAFTLVSLAASRGKHLVSIGNRPIMIDPHEALSILEYGPELQVPHEAMFPPFPLTVEVYYLFRKWNPNFFDYFIFDKESMKWVPKLGSDELKKIRTARFKWMNKPKKPSKAKNAKKS